MGHGIYDESEIGTLERSLSQQKAMLVGISRGLDKLAGRRGAQPPDMRSVLLGAIADGIVDHMTRPASAGETAVRLPELLTRAAVNPASTTAAGWAAQLAQPANVGVFAALAPASAYSRLSARGLKVDLSGVSSIRIPTRSTPGDLAAAFIGEGGAIPVKSSGLTVALVEPKKLGVISFFSAELGKRSKPSIEAILRQLLAEDAGAYLDSVFLGNAAGSAIQPPGLRYNVTPIAAAAGGGAAALSTDVGALLSAISPAADPVLLMGEAERARMVGLVPGFVTLAVEVTTGLPAKTVMAVDAAALATGEGDAPDISIGTDAVIHAETVPLAIGTPGAPATVAAPASSLWQQNLIGLRLLQDVAWSMRSVNKVAVVANVTW